MGNVEIPRWLKDLPLAPEFRPTDTEFADPVAYISKIEKEASAFGICKIIPPLPKPSKRYVISNLNKSLSKCPELDVGVGLSSPCSSLRTDSGDSANHEEVRAVFTTRLQELGQGMKRTKGMIRENPQLGVHKQVWQSGEIYTLEQFETKSKAFARSMLGLIKEINPLVIEALFWGAASEKPISVEYANDVPGSAFGEPESQFRYFHRRRRKRASYRSYRRSTESSDCKKVELDNVKNSSNEEVKGTAIKNDSCTSSETMPTSSITLSTSYLKETLRSSKQRSLNASNDMEGTAGWTLSNSPWNLQVIARSPGSLTRFMPDDIPGVTSPMIYIGMLFSWFAWHVEDHELHSMNFLHTGSPKTWYSVPGDYAFAFEEVIRTEAYGGSIDRLAALTLLGEKTTLMSPEVVVSSDIPCCRLVQNPGEFVVTFPRAYHVGFSHGFNCGEAANFGTPQWLKVAKEAAVRRAAMNYLPMLSHQQLLYLLTMSFVSRVPRSLLPGARSSRLRDRLKEERELSVKKAFIEDILKENSILSVLLGKESACNVVIWNPDLLPCASKESQLLNTISSTTEENVFHTCSEDNSNTTENDLFKEMSLYMETLNDLYVDDADLSCDFQVDSGTLPCVACGILGFPFMSVVKPSETASVQVLQMDHSLIQEESKAEKFEHCHSSAVPDGFIRGSIADLALPSGWKNCSKILRPRIFCLEHGLQIEELLRSKGGANMRIICHSDYQKMKAHAVAIAEEIDIPFHYKEVPLENASQEDLNLIYLAIDNEDHEECGEDWTSKMGINLRYCVKVRKNSPSNKVQHAFALGGLFSDGSTSDFLNIKWQSKRSRSQMTLNKRAQYKPCDAVEAKKNVLGRKSDNVVIERKEKLIQYTRKKYKVKIDCSTTRGEGFSREYMEEEVSVASCEALMKHTGKTSKIDNCNVGIGGSDSAGICFSPIGMSGVLHDVQVLEATGDMSLNSGSLDITSSLIPPTAGVEHVVRLIDNQTLEKTNRKENVWDLAVSCKFKIQQEEKVTGGTGVDGDSNATGCSRPCVTEANERPEMQGGYQMTQNISLVNETCNMVSEGQHKVLAGRDVLLNEVGDLAKPISLNVSHPPTGQMEDIVADKFCMNNEVCVCLTTDNEVKQELQTRKKRNNSECISYNDTLMNQLAASEKSTKCLQDTFAAEGELQHEDEITGESNAEEIVLKNVRMINQPNNISVDEHSEISREPCAAANLCYDGTLGNGVLQAIQTPNERKEEHASCSARQMEIDQTTTLVEGFPEVLEGISSEEDLCTGTTLDSQLLLKIPATNRSNVEKLASYSSSQIQDPSVHVTVEGYFEVPGGKCAAKDLYIGMKNLDVKVQDIHSDDGLSTNDEAHEICQTTSATNEKENLFKKWSGTEEESCTAENTLKGQEVCSSHKLESIESAVVDLRTTAGKGKKRKNELEQLTDNKLNSYAFIRSPCEGLRPRAGKDATYRSAVDVEKIIQENPVTKKTRKHSDGLVLCSKKKEAAKRSHKCDLEGCPMSFETKAELQLHKRNRCPYEGCKKRFNSHKYAIIHQRVHEDDRPLKCPWKGCSMSFKWAWARTEHIRVHTGEKPYKCKVEGCGLSFRFVSDFSRHRRKTGHYVNTPA